MAKPIIIDEVHVTVRVPARLPPSAADAVTRTLTSTIFRRRLQKAMERLCRRYTSLARVTVRVS